MDESQSIHSYHDEESDNNNANRRKSGRPSNPLVWENVKLETIMNEDGTAVCQQTCIHCNKVNRAHKPQTTWWATHLVDRGPKGCAKCPVAVRNAILNSTKSKQVLDAAMGLTSGASVSLTAASTGQRRRGPAPVAVLPNNVGSFVKRGLSKLLEDNILVEEVADGNISQTCRHCKKNRTCKQTLATVWSKHFVDISSKGCPDAPFYVRRAIAAESSSAEVRRLAESQGWVLEMGTGSNRNGGDQAMQAEAGDQKQSSRPQKRAKIAGGGDTCSEPPDGCCQAQADSISMKIMEFVTSCGLSMLLVQSPIFLDLLRALNKAYVDRYLTKSDVFVQTWLPKLHSSISNQIGNLWKEQQQKNELGTLGLWGGDKHKCFGSDGPTGKVLTETLQDNKIVFWDTIKASSEEGVTAEGLAQTLSEHMTEMAGGEEVKIEDTYAAVVVTSNATMNVQAGTILQERFPKIFINQCRLQALKHLRDEVFRIPEIARVCSEAHFIAHFIRDHPCSSKTFAGLVHEKGGSMPSPGASRDFGEIRSLLTSLCGGGGTNRQNNAECFSALVRDSEWVASSAVRIDAQLAQHFEALVSDAETFSRFQALSQLLSPLAAFTKHMERPDVRASWIYPLFQALLLDVKLWCTDDDGVKLVFKREDTFEQLRCALNRCWKGEALSDRPGLYSPQLLLATLLDPTTCPDSDNLPEDWDNDSEAVLKRFYSGKELLDANSELMTLLDHQGKFGREVERYKEALKTVVPSQEGHYSNVQRTVDKQLPSVDMKPQLVWKLTLKSSFPLLQPIARRVLVMGTSAVDASWANKLHHALHLKAFNPNNQSNVLMLLYSHLNLGSIQRGKNSESEAGTSSTFEDFLGQAILESPQASTSGVETGYQADICCESEECSCCC